MISSKTTTHALRLSSQISKRLHSSTATTAVKLPEYVSMKEISLPLKDGMVLAGQHWTYNNDDDDDDDESKTGSTQKILALHGWLDNCRSYHILAPQLISRLNGKAEIVALDLPGHGWSSHKSIDGPPTLLSEGVYYVSEALYKLGWINKKKTKKQQSKENGPTVDNSIVNVNDDDDDDDDDDNNGDKVTLLGHSMGGGISLVYAAAFPEHVDKLVMLDIYSPLPGDCDKTVSSIRSHIETRHIGPKPHRIYKSIDQAVQARIMSAVKAPGNQSLSVEAATELVTRATQPIEDNQGFSFRHDTRLLWPSLQYLMPEQIESIMKSVECSTCILAAENGWPFKQDRVGRALELIEPSVHKIVPGSHHFHADPSTANSVVDEVYDFVAERKMKYVL